MTQDMRNVLVRQEDHDRRITFLEEWVGGINEEIKALQQIVNALESSDFITGIEETATTLTLHFKHSSSIVIRKGEKGDPGIPGTDGTHGQPGTDGQPGQDGTNGTDAPRLGVSKQNNRYYWTLTTAEGTEFLTDNKGNRIPVTGNNGAPGNDGQPGHDGQPGITPVLGVSDAGNWTLNGAEIIVDGQPLPVTGPDGDKGKDGKDGQDSDRTGGGSYFKKVDTSSGEMVVFTLKDGSTFTLPRWLDLSFEFTVSSSSLIRIKRDESIKIAYKSKHVKHLQIKTPEGWKADADTVKKVITLFAPSASNSQCKTRGELSVTVSNGTGSVLTLSRPVKLWLPTFVIDMDQCDFSGSDVYLCYSNSNQLIAEICLEYIPGYSEICRQRAKVIYPWIASQEIYERGIITNTSGGIDHDGKNYMAGNNTVTSKLFIDSEGTFVEETPEAEAVIMWPDYTQDADNNIYKVVKIGRQYWLKENLKATQVMDTDRNVRNLQAGTDYITFIPGKETTYGWLYDYTGAVKNPKKSGFHLCPSGWHIPESGEWLELLRLVADKNDLKAVSPEWTSSPQNKPTDLAGFGALPGGYYENNIPPKMPVDYYASGYWWSSSEHLGVYTITIILSYNSKDYSPYMINNYAKLLSIRCIRDSKTSE